MAQERNDLSTLPLKKSVPLGCVPGEWKTAVVKPVFKGGRKDRRLPVNYRPISLTSCAARIPEKIVHHTAAGILAQE